MNCLRSSSLVEVADLSGLRARIYVSEFEMYKFRPDSPARIQVDGSFRKHTAQTVGIAPVSSEIAPGLIDLSQYKGQQPPRFYVFNLTVENEDGAMRPGMTGTARVYGDRRTLVGLTVRTCWEFMARKLW
jgi:hypothetical protein